MRVRQTLVVSAAIFGAVVLGGISQGAEIGPGQPWRGAGAQPWTYVEEALREFLGKPVDVHQQNLTVSAGFFPSADCAPADCAR